MEKEKRLSAELEAFSEIEASPSLDKSEKLTKEDIEREVELERLENLKQDRKERKVYANKAFRLICWYLGIVTALLIAAGVEVIPFYLSEAVELALLTTTTANVLTIFYFVMKYLFNPKGK